MGELAVSKLGAGELDAAGFGAVITGAIATAQAIQHPGAIALALAGLDGAGPHLVG